MDDQIFPVLPKTLKWKDWDPEGTSTDYNDLRTELWPPSCRLEGMPGRPMKGKAWELGGNGRTGVPKLFGPQDRSNPTKNPPRIEKPRPQHVKSELETYKAYVSDEFSIFGGWGYPSCLMLQYDRFASVLLEESDGAIVS